MTSNLGFVQLVLSLLVVQEIRFAQRSIQRVFFFLFAKLQGGGSEVKGFSAFLPRLGQI